MTTLLVCRIIMLTLMANGNNRLAGREKFRGDERAFTASVCAMAGARRSKCDAWLAIMRHLCGHARVRHLSVDKANG